MNQNQLKQLHTQAQKRANLLKGAELFATKQPLRNVDDLTNKMVEKLANYLLEKRQTLKVTKICDDCGSKLTVDEASAKLDEMDKLTRGGETGDILNYNVFKEDDQWLMTKKDCPKCQGKGVMFSTPVITFNGQMEVKIDGYKITGLPLYVHMEEVAAQAKSKCKNCCGSGIFTVTRPYIIPGTAGKGNFRKYDSACMCARERFLKQNPNVLMDHDRGEWVLIKDFSATYDPEFAEQEKQEDLKKASELKAVKDVQDATEKNTAYEVVNQEDSNTLVVKPKVDQAAGAIEDAIIVEKENHASTK